MSMQVEEVKDYYYPLVSSEQNVKNQDEDGEFSVAVIFGKDWIKIGDEYFQNPAGSPPWSVTLKQVLNEQFARSSEEEEEEEEEPLNSNTGIVLDSPTKTPENVFIKNHCNKLEEKYVKLHIVNMHFMSEKEEEEEEEVSSYCRFITKRPYLYE